MRTAAIGLAVFVCALAAACSSGDAVTAATPSVSDRAGLPDGVEASISVGQPGAAPVPVVVAYGSVWVGAHRAGQLYRIDPDHNTTTVIVLGQNVCGPLRAAADHLFAGWCDGSDQTKVVDPATNTVVASMTASEVFGLADGALWAGSNDGLELLKIDPSTYRTVATYPVAATEGVVGDGRLWVAGELGSDGEYHGVIDEIDPATGAVVATIHTPTTSQAMMMGYVDGVLWLHGSADPFLVRVDTSTGDSTQVALTSDHPSYFEENPPVVGMGSLWLRLSPSTVARLDPRTGTQLGVYPADPAGGGGYPAAGLGSLWVANALRDTVWRDAVAP